MTPTAIALYRCAKATNNRDALARISAAQHFDIDPKVFTAAKNLWLAQTEKEEEARKQEASPPVPVFSKGGRLPAPQVTFGYSLDGLEVSCLAFERDGMVEIWAISDFGLVQWCAYEPGGVKISRPEGTTHKEASVTASFLSVVWTLINIPHHTTDQDERASRQQRRRTKRELGLDSSVYTRVQWKIGSVRKSKKKGEGDGSNTRLHFVRAHYRRCEEHHENAEFIYGGWHKYIECHWRGDPLLGVTVKDYAPQSPDEEISQELQSEMRAHALRQAGVKAMKPGRKAA